jgi:hypothetical protein
MALDTWFIMFILCIYLHHLESREIFETNVTCEVDEELTSLVNMPNSRTLMYVFCHNDVSAEIASNRTRCWGDWIQIVRLDKSKYFESAAYAKVFPDLSVNRKEYDYILTATYKTLTHRIHGKLIQGISELKHGLKVMRANSFDVFPFMRAQDDSRFWGEKFHGHHYSVCWDTLLIEQGFTNADIHSYDHIGVFYRNIYIAKLWAFETLVKKMKQAIELVESSSKLQVLFSKDSGYIGADGNLAKELFNHTNYAMHPFIFERLPAFYFHNMGASMCFLVPDCPENF